MTTLNQIKAKLISFFQSHAQINQVVWGDDFDFNAERGLTYPVVNIEFVDSNISEKMLNYNFKISIGDLIDVDNPDQADDVMSDAILIAEDFFSYLQVEEGWVFTKSTRLNKFVDDTGDRVSGVVFNVVLSVVRSQNECAIPNRNP